MNVEGGLQISDLWGIVRRRGRIVAGTALVLVLAGYWIAMALPNEYTSYATVLVTPQTVDPGLVAAGIPESDINNRLFLMTAQILSRGRLSRIIDELDLYPDESEYMVREEVIDLMRSRITVAPVISELSDTNAKTQEAINQFKISFTSKGARTAMVVVTTLSREFIEQHIDSRISQSQKSLEFIEGELTRLADRIRDVEARVADVKAENPGRLPENVAANQRRLERLTSELSFSQRSYSEAVSDEAFFRSQSSNATVVSEREETSPARRLKTLELLIVDYKSRGFTDKHPDLVKSRLEMDELKTQIAQQIAAAEVDAEEDVESDEIMSFAQQNAEAERHRAVLRRDSAGEEISRLQGAIDAVQILLSETPPVAEQLDGLEREYEHLSNSYQDFSNRNLEATVQAQLERRQLGEQFRVLEAAFIAPEPTSPDRTLIMAFGVVFALGIGIGIGVVLEGVDGSVHTALQLQNALGIPVLAAIPQIQLEADLQALRRSRIRSLFGAAAVTVFALAGGAMNYMWVNGTPAFLSGGPSPIDAPEDGEPTPVEIPALDDIGAAS